MTPGIFEFDPNHLAAVVYRPEDDVDTLLFDLAMRLRADAVPIGGIVQRNLKNAEGKKIGMQVVDLSTGADIRISQRLGSGSTSCTLDPSGLAEAAHAVVRAVARRASLVVVNKFSKQEAAGQGLRQEFAEAVSAGLPVLTAVPEKILPAWRDFTGDRGTTLACTRHVVEDWWREIAAREAALCPA